VYIFQTPLYIYSIVQKVQVCFTSKTNFSNLKHDPSKTTSMKKYYILKKNTINKFPYFELIAKKILLKSLNSNLKSNSKGIFNFWFQKILINIGKCNSRSKHMDTTYMS
jgi:hypothetical protein